MHQSTREQRRMLSTGMDRVSLAHLQLKVSESLPPLDLRARSPVFVLLYYLGSLVSSFAFTSLDFSHRGCLLNRRVDFVQCARSVPHRTDYLAIPLQTGLELAMPSVTGAEMEKSAI